MTRPGFLPGRRGGHGAHEYPATSQIRQDHLQKKLPRDCRLGGGPFTTAVQKP